MNTALVYSKNDAAGKNIAKMLGEIGLPEWANIYSFEEDSVNLPLQNVSEDNIIVLSKHSSSAEIKSLTVHSIGNFSIAEYRPNQ